MAQKYWLGTVSTPGSYSVASNWSPSGVPVANDDVFITGAQAITAGLNQSAVELDDFIVLASMSGAIGSILAPLQIDMADTDRFEYAGSGLAFIDVGTAGISPVILNTANATPASPYGLVLTGSALATIDLRKGSLHLRGATVTTVVQSWLTTQLTDSKLYVPVGTTLTNLLKSGGSAIVEVNTTTIENQGGELAINGTATIGTLTVDDGNVYHTSSGTVTLLEANGGVTDFTRSRTPRTITDITLNGGTVRLDPDVVTVTNTPTGRGTIEYV